ncbi:MAG: agmatine deiminase family protein [Sulfurovum sp.]|nr:agmatine deiminase family protein [Sulfurovum sp.]
MNKKTTVYFSDLLRIEHPVLFSNLKSILNRHRYEVTTLKETKDIWIRDFMPIVFDDKCIQYRYEPDYLMEPSLLPYRTDPNDPIKELGLQTEKIELILDGGNVVKCHDTAIMTNKAFEENKSLEITCDTLKGKLPPRRRLIILPRDPHPEEIYGHADGMVRFIKQNHILVNSQYPDNFKHKLHHSLNNSGLKTTELKVKENTKYAWGYINFLHLDDLIIQPAIDKVNDAYVKSQLEELYPNTIVELCDAKAILKKGGGFNCISWEYAY